jgi:hypothetical protein
MRRLALALLVLLAPSIAGAASGPVWTTQQLAGFADVVLTGTVVEVTSDWDRHVNAIYTYVTLDVIDVLKGDISAERVTIKQLGGSADGIVLSIVDQPSFAIGQDVLVYLEARPRDGTLYTSALWQGKWDLERGVRGRQTAVRYAPGGHATREDRQSLSEARLETSAAAADRTGVTPNIVVSDAPLPRASAYFNLLGPFRYVHSPVVDVQAGGQPGLPGGGVAQVQAAIQRWNRAGAAFSYTLGNTNAPPRCSGELLGNNRVTITFMDPCGEMANAGGTLALGGSYFTPGEGGSSNGQSFDRATEGFIVNNDGDEALRLPTNPGCFEEIQTHELGHVLGLNHSGDPDALMYAQIEASRCWTGARGLRPDDLRGLLFIYGGGAPSSGLAQPLAAPTDVRVVMQTTSLLVTWSDSSVGTSAAPTSYQVDFRAGHQDGGPVVASSRQQGTSLAVTIPPGVSGDFNVVVSGVNDAGVGPSSPRRDFTIGAGGSLSPGCSGSPSAPIGLSGSVLNGVAQVRWSATPGATRYLLQAGNDVGGADLFALTDVGATTGAATAVPPGFRAWVRVFAANSCGVSAPADVLLQ